MDENTLYYNNKLSECNIIKRKPFIKFYNINEYYYNKMFQNLFNNNNTIDFRKNVEYTYERVDNDINDSTFFFDDNNIVDTDVLNMSVLNVTETTVVDKDMVEKFKYEEYLTNTGDDNNFNTTYISNFTPVFENEKIKLIKYKGCFKIDPKIIYNFNNINVININSLDLTDNKKYTTVTIITNKDYNNDKNIISKFILNSFDAELNYNYFNEYGRYDNRRNELTHMKLESFNVNFYGNFEKKYKYFSHEYMDRNIIYDSSNNYLYIESDIHYQYDFKGVIITCVFDDIMSIAVQSSTRHGGF